MEVLGFCYSFADFIMKDWSGHILFLAGVRRVAVTI
jgi:hypothetical protein